MFIMVDGIDGSGKSTVIATWKEHLLNTGKKVFDLKKYWQEKNAAPLSNELLDYDYIISCEPTYVGLGSVIRHELIRQGTAYSARSIAEAYALDRLILYQTVLLPFLANGKCVIQDRGVSTSYAYQPTADASITYNFLNSLEGNALALKHRPDFLVLLPTHPTVAMTRLNRRSEKQDNVIFEKLDFAERLTEQFASETYRHLFIDRGTIIKELPGNEEIDTLKQEAVALLKTILTF